MNKTILSYFTLVRLAAIRKKLTAGEPFTANTLAAELECSTRTIYRDIEFLRDRFGYEMEFNNTTNKWGGRVPDGTIL
jgi:predicted DNA-binding transcriptional regulator YafY